MVPPVLAPGLTRAVGVRGNQLQHPLVTVLTFGDLHQDGQGPPSVDVRDEQVDGLVDAPCLYEHLGEVTAFGPRGTAGFVQADQFQDQLRPSRPAQLLHRALGTEPLAEFRCRLDNQVQATVLQQQVHSPRGKTAEVARLPRKIVHVHGRERRSNR